VLNLSNVIQYPPQRLSCSFDPIECSDFGDDAGRIGALLVLSFQQSS
jgi:hypothetical protein